MSSEILLENNLKETYLVQKSKPLVNLWKSNLTLNEFKILDIYLSRINSHNPEQRSVIFSKGEMEKLFEVKQIKPSELKKHLKSLMCQTIEVKIDDTDDFMLITLFSMAYCKKDKNEQWEVELSCTEEAIKYFFNIEEIGYLRYKLRNVMNLTSRYSYILFLYLENNRFRKSWEIEIEELKEILKCNKKSYEKYKEFNRYILKKSYNELQDKTSLKYTYEPIKIGRKTTGIRFNLENLVDFTNDFYISDMKCIERNKVLLFLSEACNNEFTELQMNEIFQIVCTKNLEENALGIDFARYHYLSKAYAKLEVMNEQTEIKNRYAYFLKLI